MQGNSSRKDAKNAKKTLAAFAPLRETIFMLSVIILLYSCSGNKATNQDASLFDIKGFFEIQADSLTAVNPKVHKTVVQNGQEESKDLYIADWKTELKPFLETDISKPALRNSFKIDSTGTHITYTAVDSSLVIRSIEITTASITIIKRTGNNLISSRQTLTWKSNEGYSIEGDQDISFGKGNNYSIKVSFPQ